MRPVQSAALALFLLTTAAPAALAQTPPVPAGLPQPLAANPRLPEPRDVAYPGVIKLAVDATDIDRRIYRVKQTIPVSQAGRMTLLYPKWIPGNHKAAGPIDKLAGLKISGGGRPIPWTRDTEEVYAYHVDVPRGVRELDVEFQFVTPLAPNQGRVVMTPAMLNLQMGTVVMYPAGWYARRIQVEPSVTLPDGWTFGTALEKAGGSGATTRFKPVSLDVFQDSPMFAGRYGKVWDLNPGGTVPVRLNVFADTADELDAKPEQIEAHRKMVQQFLKLYGGHHFNHYDFLLAISAVQGGIGLEHHRSSENGVGLGYFKEWEKEVGARDLLPHEMNHSWDGKWRRPADQFTANFEVPIRNSLLWVYEGQTQYWGVVIAARSGLWTKQQTLDDLALTAATYLEGRPGRSWRSLQDTVNEPIISNRSPQPWRAYQRPEDYYQEGQLIWLEADQLIRERSNGARSLDDFAKAFFGGVSDGLTPATYTFDDVVNVLNSVERYDWRTFLRTRLDGAGPAPLDWIKKGGYRLVWSDTPSDLQKTLQAGAGGASFTYSLGISPNKDGVLGEVLWDSPAWKAGLTSGATLVAVNGKTYSPDALRDAVTAGKGGTPIELLVKRGDRYQTVKLDYRGGLRYPRLERVEGTPDRLGELLAAR